MKTLTLFVAGLWIAAAAVAQPAPTPTPVPESAKRPFSLDLAQFVAGNDRTGHAEFNLELRREIWNDPMVRLEYAMSREEVAARRSGMFGFPTPFAAGTRFVGMPGADPRLVLKGPWAEDWDSLTPGEKMGRITETAVFYGVIFEILRALR